jgi:hypothetical protein
MKTGKLTIISTQTQPPGQLDFSHAERREFGSSGVDAMEARHFRFHVAQFPRNPQVVKRLDTAVEVPDGVFACGCGLGHQLRFLIA